MSSSSHQACCYCGRTIPRFGPDVFALSMDEPRGPRVVLTWCMGCAEVDPLHLELAGATNLPDGRAGDDAVAAVYLRLLDRIGAERGADGLRAAVRVRRDTDGSVTMRGPGLLWGRRSCR